MTFCVGVRVRGGLVGLADTQIVKGGEVSSKAKLSLHQHGGHQFFVMTSGLRSVRDKVVSAWRTPSTGWTAAPSAARGRDRLRRRTEAACGPRTGHRWSTSGLRFNLHAIIGGQLADDDEPELFLIYPEGNWVIATDDSPSFIIGRTAYGKPILDRLLTPSTDVPHAVALAYLAFDATRASVVDVEFPIDVVVITDGELRQHRYEPDDLAAAHDSWQRHLEEAVVVLPIGWAARLLPASAEDR